MIYSRPEENAITCIARRDLDLERRSELRGLLREELDWNYLYTMAVAHGLLPLLYKHLNSAASDLVPGHFFSRLKRESVANSQNVLHLIGKQLRIHKLFDEHDIPVASFKGPLLAQTAYGEISLRQAGDIDLLIHRRHFAKARAILESLGYEMAPALTDTQLSSHLNSHCELQFMRDDWFTIVDLHWDLAPRTFVFNLPGEEVLSRRHAVWLAGAEVETFALEDSVLYQATHGAKHLWRRLEWIVAMAETLRTAPAINWDTLVQRAEQARAARILALALQLVRKFSDVDIPEQATTALDPGATMERMAETIRKQIFTIYGAADSTETNLYNLRIMDRKRDALISALRAVFVPTFTDWQALALPAPLHSLYYAYRPLRLAKVYGASLWRKLSRM